MIDDKKTPAFSSFDGLNVLKYKSLEIVNEQVKAKQNACFQQI